MISLVRGHQVKLDGYEFHHWEGKEKFPLVITLFSAPNYWGHYKNKGALLRADESGKLEVKQYRWVKNPYCLDPGLNVFTKFMPNLFKHVLDTFFHMLN